MSIYVDEDSSNGLRILLLLYVMVSLSLCGGTVFGFEGLEAVLLDEGVYQELCTGAALVVPCNEQMLRLNLMFTLASSLFSVYLFPAGLLLQSIGPRHSFIVGFLLVLAGSIIFIFANSKTFDVYIPAFMLIGTGNPLLYISAFNFSKLFPQTSNVLLSMFIGCFGFSAIVFYGFEKAHFLLDLSSNQLFMAFSLVPVTLILLGIFLLPKDVYHVQREKKLASVNNTVNGNIVADKDTFLNEITAVDEKTPLLIDKVSSKDDGETTPLPQEGEPLELDGMQDKKMRKSSNNDIPVKDMTIRQQLQTSQFIAQTIFFSWGMLHLNFYLGTVYDQLYLMDEETDGEMANEIAETFDLAYPLGCLGSILPVGLLVRNTKISTSVFVYCVANLIFAALSLVSVIEIQWVTVHFFILVRVAFFTVMSTYSAYMFGFKHLSTMFGAAGCVAGLASLLSYGLSFVALSVDDEFRTVNTVLFVGAVLNFAFPTATRQYWENED